MLEAFLLFDAFLFIFATIGDRVFVPEEKQRRGLVPRNRVDLREYEESRNENSKEGEENAEVL
jgi:hypothetical protein